MNAEEFKKEFKALLQKYEVSIGFTCADGSDTYGIYDEKIVVEDKKGNKILSAQGYWLDHTNIQG